MHKFLPTSQLFSVNRKGYTLVELLVVVSIIAILSVIGLTVFSGTQKSARDAKRKSDIDAISKALESRYNTSKDQYCTANAGTYCVPQQAWFSGGIIPTDPQTNGSYTGLPADGATTYKICASLESPAGTTYCQTQQQ